MAKQKLQVFNRVSLSLGILPIWFSLYVQIYFSLNLIMLLS